MAIGRSLNQAIDAISTCKGEYIWKYTHTYIFNVIITTAKIVHLKKLSLTFTNIPNPFAFLFLFSYFWVKGTVCCSREVIIIWFANKKKPWVTSVALARTFPSTGLLVCPVYINVQLIVTNFGRLMSTIIQQLEK